MTDKILVSACLLGRPVRYNGSAKTIEHPALERWRQEGRIVSIVGLVDPLTYPSFFTVGLRLWRHGVLRFENQVGDMTYSRERSLGTRICGIENCGLRTRRPSIVEA
jgi:hypothetical protein